MTYAQSSPDTRSHSRPPGARLAGLAVSEFGRIDVLYNLAAG